MPRKKQGLRSYHHKSRNGCSNCKRRRVKCNMQAPACANCVRRNEVCEYQSLGQPAGQWSSEVSMLSDRTSALVPSSVDANIDPALLGASSYAPLTWIAAYAGPISGTLESNITHPSPLKYHISKILANSWFTPKEIKLWGNALESSGSKYPYVQHSLLSLSTLIDEFNYRIEFPKANQQAAPVFAYHHHITASALFRQSPPVVDEHNWVAVLIFGLSLIIFHFAIQQLHPDPEFNVLETFRILRTTMALNEESLPHLKSSIFWPLILNRTILPNLSVDVKLRTALQNMGRVITHAVESGSENADVHKQAFWELREWAFECQGNPRTWRHYLIWPAALCEEYLDLVSSGDEISLLIFIYWCAIMYQSPRRWFITSWSKRTALTAMRMLKADWGTILYWPLEVFEMIPTVLPEAAVVRVVFQSNVEDRVDESSAPSFDEWLNNQ